MKSKQEKYERMIGQIDVIIHTIRKWEKKYADALAAVHPEYEKSARNLIHYRAMRTLDIRKLQKGLGDLGLSRLAKAEIHIIASLLRSRSVLESLAEEKPIRLKEPPFSIKNANKLLNRHSAALLGSRSEGRRTRIMVTLPSDAAINYPLVEQMIQAGMNTARINCAHDGPEAWKKMIQHVHAVNEATGSNCKVAMDLAGPKIRTGAVAPGPRLLKFRPARDLYGRTLNPVRLWLGPEPADTAIHIPLPQDFIQKRKKGEKLYFLDARGKKRKIKIVSVESTGCWGECSSTSYVETGMKLFLQPDGQGERVEIGHLPPMEQSLLLVEGDRLVIHSDPAPGENAVYDSDGTLQQPAHISCTSWEVFDRVQPGESILFDDGKIRGEVLSAQPGQMEVKITGAQPKGDKLRADKGINFPNSDLGIRGLTAKDREDLAFVVQHADVVNMSFVNTEEDVADLLEAIRAQESEREIGVIFKIETQSGFDHLTSILLAAMRMHPVGVMVARGDLAVETGWENMARIQEEMLSLCRAAHIPDIWATQVLESLAKKGIPSRAEITDAGMSQRAECVMLNKGPEILRAIRMLDSILKDREAYMEKNAPMLPIMGKAKR